MSPSSPKRRAGKPRVSTPWARKRKRVFVVFLVFAVVLSPAVVWRLRLANEVHQLVAEHRERGLPLRVEVLHEGGDLFADSENGAQDLRTAARIFQGFSQQQKELLPFQPGRKPHAEIEFSDEQWGVITAVVAANREVLERLYAGAEKSYIRYPQEYLSDDAMAAEPDADTLSAFAVLLCCDAVLAADAKDSASAWRALRAALAVIRSLGANGLLDTLYRQWELESGMLYALQWVLGETPADAVLLSDFAAYFTREQRVAQWQRACDVELSDFVTRLSGDQHRSLFQSLLIAAGVGDLNLKVAFSLYEPMRSGFGLPPEEQRAYETAYFEAQQELKGHGLLYATVRRHHEPPYWDVMRAACDEVVVAEHAFSIENYRITHGVYPESDGLEGALGERMLSEGVTLEYEGGAMGYRLLTRDEQGGVSQRWGVVPARTLE